MTIPLSWILWGSTLIGLMSLVFGIFTVIWPRQSIGIYVWIMEKFNWRVSPLDETHETRVTRFLGFLLILLSLIPLANFLLRHF